MTDRRCVLRQIRELGETDLITPIASAPHQKTSRGFQSENEPRSHGNGGGAWNSGNASRHGGSVRDAGYEKSSTAEVPEDHPKKKKAQVGVGLSHPSLGGRYFESAFEAELYTVYHVMM